MENLALQNACASLPPWTGFVWSALTIFMLVTMWLIYEKAGKAGWKSIIPIYNVLVFLQIIGKPWWWIILAFIPIVGVIFYIWAMNLLSKRFGKSELFTVGIIFLPYVFLPILAFGSAQYTK
ncbi:MAG TPA: hypothetical protein DEG09_02065 [Marinilabiliaceae bacterium]|nr:hypothetical protein [Marinilabiliaceae bacterium]